MLIKYEAHSPLGCSKLNKHGFHPDDTPAPRGLGWQVLKTMLIRYDARDTLGAAGQISMVSIPGAY